MHKINPISGSFAIPAPDAEVLYEEPTSGLENIVDWDDLEEALLDGHLASKEKFRELVASQFDAYNAALPKDAERATLTRHHLQMVLDGLCNLPSDTELTVTNLRQGHALMVRAAYDALPERGLINLKQARLIREASAKGRSQRDIAAEFGISRQAVSDVVNLVTWRDVA